MIVPLSAELSARIRRSVEAGFAEQIAFTQALIRFHSTRGSEHTIQDFVYRALKQRGYAMDRFAMDRDAIGRHPGGAPFSATHSDAPVVVGIHRPTQELGRSLILQSHVDVVPPGPADLWTHPPFEPVIDGDWLYGRGSADMKAGHAAMIFCLDALRRIGKEPAATVYVQSVVEEEGSNPQVIPPSVQLEPERRLLPAPQYSMKPPWHCAGVTQFFASAHHRTLSAPCKQVVPGG